MLFLFSSVLLLLPLPTSTLVALGEPQLAHNVICRVVYLANNKNRTGSQWLEANLRESEEYKTPIGRPVASGRTLSDRTSGAGSPSDRGPCWPHSFKFFKLAIDIDIISLERFLSE